MRFIKTLFVPSKLRFRALYILVYRIHFGDTAVLQSICRQIERGRRLINEVGIVPFFPASPRVYPPRPTAIIVCARVQTLVSRDIKKIKIKIKREKREKGYGFSGCVFLGDDIRPRARIINSRRPVYATFLYRTYIVCTRAPHPSPPQYPHGPSCRLAGGRRFSGIYIYSTNVYNIHDR